MFYALEIQASDGRGRCSGVSRLKTTQLIDTKSGTNDDDSNIYLGYEVHCDRFRGFVCPKW
jgi:hypothetical protein